MSIRADSTLNHAAARKMTLGELESLIVQRLVAVLRRNKRGPLPRTAEFSKLGVDSLLALELRNSLELALGIVVPTRTLWEHPTTEKLAAHLHAVVRAHSEPESVPRPRAGLESRPVEAKTASGKGLARDFGEPIAVVGVAAQFPGALNMEELWERLLAGESCIGGAPESRWPPDEQWEERRGGFLEGVENFDHELFGMSPAEADQVGPAVRLLLRAAWRTFEDAGITVGENQPATPTREIGVFVGSMYNHFPRLPGAEQQADLLFDTSAFPLANRISHFFDLRGPSLAVDAACASSTLAIHMACQSLRSGECEMALAGGVNLTLHPVKFAGLDDYQVLSHAGVSRALGPSDGIVPGEGVGLFLLEPLSLALQRRHRIDALVIGSAASHNGRGVGYTAPNPRAQARLLECTLKRAAMAPRDVDYIEVAANGSPVAEEGEMAALLEVFGGSCETGSIPIGTVKNNLGHLEAASGVSQLAKILLHYRHRCEAPTINTEPHNQHLGLDKSPFFVRTKPTRWEKGEPKRTLIDSFGGGGSGGCLLVEEYQGEKLEHPRAEANEACPCLIALSAPDDGRLARVVQAAEVWVREESADSGHTLEDLSRTLTMGRTWFDERLAVVVESWDQLAVALQRVQKGDYSGARRGNAKKTGGSANMFERDTDLRRVCRAWVRKGRLLRLAELWVNGVDLEWEGLAAVQNGRLIRGPRFPFQEKRFWPDMHGGFATRSPPSRLRTSPGAGALTSDDSEYELHRVRCTMAELLQIPVDQIDPDRSLQDYGCDSLIALRLARRLVPSAAGREAQRQLLALKSPRAWSQHLHELRKVESVEA